MTDEEVERKAGRAESLRTDKRFVEFYQEAIDDQVKVFLNADAAEVDIGEAHAMIRALTKLKARMDIATSRAKVVRGRKAKG